MRKRMDLVLKRQVIALFILVSFLMMPDLELASYAHSAEIFLKVPFEKIEKMGLGFCIQQKVRYTKETSSTTSTMEKVSRHSLVSTLIKESSSWAQSKVRAS